MENTNKYQVYENQSWLDISTTLFGTPAHAYDLAVLNSSNLTEEISAGTFISFHSESDKNRLVLLSMQENKSIPATAISQEQKANGEHQGISYWTIGTNFIVK